MDAAEKERILEEAFPLINGVSLLIETKGPKNFTLGQLRKRLNEDLKEMPDDTIIVTETYGRIPMISGGHESINLHQYTYYKPIRAAYGTLGILQEDGKYLDAIGVRRRTEGTPVIFIG